MYKSEKKYYLSAFFLALFMAVVIFLPFCIIDKGYFVYTGDYNAQQIPFYKVCVEAVRSGDFGWNWTTDLGVNFIGSYSFYTLGSPFFWIAALFPTSVSHYLMAPLLCLKIAFASFFAFVYIRRFVRTPKSALIGGLMYAFSGFSVYNVFFNHFHEVICFFPLLLIALEEAVVNKRRGVFALAVALNALVNYFFFFGECVFLVIYFIIRMCMSKEFRINGKDFVCLAFESVAGVAISGILFVPSMMQVLGSERAAQFVNGFDFLVYLYPERYTSLLEAMFFPEESAPQSLMFDGARTEWMSMSLYLPLFSMTGIIAFVKSHKKHWARTLLLVCLLMALIPGLNATFSMMNQAQYCRWYYMPILIMCLATVYGLENMEETDYRFGITSSLVITVGIVLLYIFIPYRVNQPVTDEFGERVDNYVIRPRIAYFGITVTQWIIFGMAVVSIIALALICRSRKKTPARFSDRIMTGVILSSLAIWYMNLGLLRTSGPAGGIYDRYVTAEFEFEEDDYFRVETIYPIHNFTMLWNLSSNQCFHSIIPPDMVELYTMMNGVRAVYSGRPYSDYAFNALTSTRYFLLDKMAAVRDIQKNSIRDNLVTFTEVDEQGWFYIYKNEYALPMGYSYDTYSLRSDVEDLDLAVKQGVKDTEYWGKISNIMVRSVILTDEQAEKYSDILTQLPTEDLKDRTVERFKVDATERIEQGVKSFEKGKSSFTVTTDYEKERLVVLPISYDKGWSAQLNGEPLEIDAVNVGFIGFRVPAGEQTITFSYETPGLKLGICITIAGAAALAAYFVLVYVILKRRPIPYAHRYVLEDADGVSPVSLHKSYIESTAGATDGGEAQSPSPTETPDNADNADNSDNADNGEV